jgi:thiamine biosynthesis lipoprotein
MTLDHQKNENGLGRRDFLKIFAISGLALGVGSKILDTFQTEEVHRFSETRLLMGTVVNLTVVSPDGKRNQSVVEKTFSEMQRWIAMFDHRIPTSPVAQLNQTGELNHPSDEVINVFEKSLSYAHLTEGAFDITVKPVLDAYRQGATITPELRALIDYQQVAIQKDQIILTKPGVQVTLDGIAKGAVIDAGVAALGSHGFENVLVEAGGDLLATGNRGNSTEWKIGINHPRNNAAGLLSQIDVHNLAVATSGDYQNHFSTDFSQHHILKPQTGESPPELASVTVLASTALDADALSTAVMVLGPDTGLKLINNLPGIEALIVTKELIIYTSQGFPS